MSTGKKEEILSKEGFSEESDKGRLLFLEGFGM